MRLSRTAVLVAAGAALYALVLRRSILTWGATEAEAAAEVPGDQLLPYADGISTRAIQIESPARTVWPWLAQMGPSPRGGAYTYDRAERDGATRLISRNRFRVHGPAGHLAMLPMEPASLVMERKMLLGIKRRAEQLDGAATC